MAGSLTQADVKGRFDYDPIRGVLVYRVRVGKCAKGAVVSYRDDQGRVRVWIKDRLYHAHQIIWLHHYGEWPSGCVDHVNGDNGDNRIENLRIATFSQNGANSKKRGPLRKGVTFEKSRSKFRAQITVHGVVRNLGRFETEEDAHAAYMAAAKQYFGEFARAA